MDTTAQILLALLGSGGGVTLIVALSKGIKGWRDGSAGRERARNTSMAEQRIKAIEERDVAEAERDEADRRRRVAEENAHRYQLQLIQNGISPGEWEHDITIPKNTPSFIYREMNNDGSRQEGPRP